MKNFIKLVVLIAVVFTSCKNDKSIPDSTNKVSIDYTEANEEEIKKYITENNIEAQKTNSGLYYIIEKQGQGEKPNANSTVRVAYKGAFTNGDVFDESNAEGVSFPLNRVIKGWTEGIPLFKAGGQGKLIIPSSLGYGNNGAGSRIPGGSVLVFDIKLLEIK